MHLVRHWRLLQAAVAVFILGAAGAGRCDDAWPVKKFEVFMGRPVTSGAMLQDIPGVGTLSVENAIRRFDDWVDLDTEETPPNPMSGAVKSEVENYQAEVATTTHQGDSGQ